MGRPCDSAKERCWRKVLWRQAASGVGVARFCEQEGIDAHQFYWWRRTLRERATSRAAVGKRARRRRLAAHRQRPAAPSPFLPVPLAISFAAPLEIVHPRGHVVRVRPGWDDHALSRILALLDESHAQAREE